MVTLIQRPQYLLSLVVILLLSVNALRAEKGLTGKETNPSKSQLIFDDCQESSLSDLGAAINAAKAGNADEDQINLAKSEVSRMMSAMMAEVTECCTPGSSEDDAEQKLDGTCFGNTDNILGIGRGAVAVPGCTAGDQVTAIRFDCYNIPQGVEITSAYIQFTAANGSTRGAAYTITGEDADDCLPFTAANPIVGRTGTSAQVAWSPPTWVQAGDALAAQQTPDISNIIQEIVDRPGYAAGNAFCIGIEGKGLRQAWSFDSGQGVPELCITYEEPEEITTCEDCPNVSLASLDGVPNFPEVNLLNVCSEPDTISLLIYNNGECDLSNVQVTIDFDAGLTYGGCVENHYGGPVTADEFDVTNPSMPVFLISQIDSAEAFIINICVKADCNVDIKSDAPLNFDALVEFSYPDDDGTNQTCALDITEVGEFNGGVRIPVLNALSVSPEEINIPNTTGQTCQTILVSQDGIQSMLSQFTLDISGIDFTNYCLGDLSVNGITIPPGDITLDMTLGTATTNISGAYFLGNGGFGANSDEIFDESENLEIEACWKAIGCTDKSMVLDYSMYYGCNEEICFGTTNATGAVSFTPNFGATAIANVSNVTYGEICGQELSYTIDLFSNNMDPVDGLWQDLLIKYGACLGNGMTISSIVVNGVPLDASLYNVDGSTLELDFTMNTDPAYGLTDEDGDGFMDDLLGGQHIIFTTNVAIGCSDSMSSCTGNLSCNLTTVEVNGKRNCGQDFQQFANLSQPISFYYGNSSTSTNAVATPGYGIPITEIIETTCDIWTPTVNGYQFGYVFDSNNIGSCASSGGIKMVATITAGGERIKDIQFNVGSASYQGNPVPGAIGYPNTIDLGGGILDTISYTVEIPAGDNMATAHDYFFNLEYRGDCHPWDYVFLNYKVVEECNSCTEVDPCEIVRACDSAASYVRWRGCGCVCDIRAFVDTIQRCNFGYADKAMTQKLTAADVPVEDLTRFLPGDTMYARIGYEIENSVVFYEGDYAWLFDVRYRGWEAALIPDVYNINFEGWFFEDLSEGTFTEMGIPTCMQNYPKATRDNFYSPSMHLDNMGVEGSANFSDSYAVCPNDDDVNPNYSSDIVNYRIYDAAAWDDANDLSRMWLYFGRQDDCPWTGGTTDPAGSTDHINDCHEEFLQQFPIADGDIIYMDLKIPLVRNPNVELGELNGTALSTTSYLYPYAYTRMNTVGTCSSSVNSRVCRTTGVYEDYLPGPVAITQDVCVTDCDTQVEYMFTLQNPLPEVDPGITPWYENEYRPFMATEYLEVSFPSNMVYLDDGVIIMPDGTEKSFSPNIDASEGNLSCLTGPGGEQCCIAADPSNLAMMKIIDDDYIIGQGQNYYRGPIAANNTNDKCDVNQLVHVPNDPFPHMAVGGAEGTCPYGLRYSLSALCPEDIESGDFQLSYQFADPYIPSLPGSEGPYNSTYLSSGNIYPSSNGFLYPINPFGTSCSTNPDPWGCVRHYENIVSHPDDSPGSINPMRQTGTIVTGPDNFADKSQNFPPLIADIQNVLIADEAMAPEINSYTVCNLSNGVDMGTHMNVVTSIEIPTTIDLVDVCDDTGTPVPWTLVEAGPTSNLYSVENPDLALDECFTIQIKTELLFCPVGLDVETGISVTTVSGCLDPSKAALFTALGETQCDAAGAEYEYIAEEAEMQAEWSRDAIGEYPLCETFEMGVRIKNVKPSILTDIEPDFWFPAGLNFVPGTWRVCYPGGPGNNGAEMSIPDPVADPGLNNIYGTNFNYADDSIWSTFIDQNGLYGVLTPQGTPTTLDSNRVEFKFEVETDCDSFTSGTSIWFRADGADPCESRTSSGFVPSNPIIIDGANPSDFAQFFVFANPLDATCGEESEITMNFLNTSPTGSTDNSMVCMDINTTTFAYMTGSVTWLTPANHMPTFTEEQNGAITHICFDVPDGIGPGQAFQVSFKFTVPDDVGCGEQDLGVQVSSTVMNANCMAQGIMCNVDVLNSVNPAIQVDFNPPVEVADQTITVGCGNGDGTVPICYDVDFANNGDDYAQDIKIKLIRDLNFNGILDPFDPPIDSVSQMITVLAGDTVNVSGCIDVLESIACPIFLMVMQETNCICDSQDFYYDSIEPAASDELGQVISVCPGEPLKIGYCGDWDYAVSPAAGASIAPNAAGDSLCINITDGYGVNSPVTLSVTSQTGGCMEFGFETDIYSLGGFDFGPYGDMNVCSSGCQMLDLNLPTEFVNEVTVLWSPTTYLDDPTSQTPILCDPQMDIDYTVTVFFMQNGQMCEFDAEFPIIVEMQPETDLFDQGSLCTDETATFVGPAGYTNYVWYEVTPAGDIPVQAGLSDTFIAPSAGTYYLEYYNATDVCKSLSTSFDVIPCPSMVKNFVDAVPTANENEYTVCYTIDVENNSTLATEYDLYDLPSFDSDIVIQSASYTSTAGPSGTLTLPPPAAPGWLIGSDVVLPGNAMHTFEVCMLVIIDLEDGVTGDDTYASCGSGGGGLPGPGEGLFNLASLDMNDDGVVDVEDEACGELPYYTIEKTIAGVTQTGAYTFTVVYDIVVCNDGGGFGEYDLTDVPEFDSDIVITGASFTSDAFEHPSNPGPTTLVGTGPWMLSDDQEMEPMECHNYQITVMVMLDLEDAATPGDGSYTACGANGGGTLQPGEGLYNTAELDTNGDGQPNDEAEACGDLPSITHEKVLTSITQTGARTYDVKYTVTVSNNGGADGMYDLTDTPLFDDDIIITGATYTSSATGSPANPGPATLMGTGPWMLADDMTVAAGTANVYCVIVSVDMDLLDPATPGDGSYSACGASVLNDPEAGEGLYNESALDLDNDGTPEEEDEACGDLPYLTHEKVVTSFVPMANGNHVVTYEICVMNIGGADGDYDLYDEPIFDDDVSIISVSYTCDIDPGSTLTIPAPTGGWLLIDDQTIAPGTTQCCEVVITVNADMSAASGGDNMITECGSASGTDDSTGGEALHNESSLDVNNDGTPDELDEACQDLPVITHEKTLASTTQQPDGSWCAVYNIVVTNTSSVNGYYDLYDAPNFEDDFTMISAQYNSTVHINTGLPIPAPAGGWQVANDELLSAGGTHVYELTSCITVDLDDPATPGDGVYTACGDGTGGADPSVGEGFFNESILDTNNDGVADEIDTVCADIPLLTLDKMINNVLQTGPRSWNVKYQITVCNDGGADGTYDLEDIPGFDSDIMITSAAYNSNATGNPGSPGPVTLAGSGPWNLADDQIIPPGECQIYSIDVYVDMDLTDPATPGNGTYSECGASNGTGDPSPGEGLYNQTTLDSNNDGTPDLEDEVCADLPAITHDKELTSITQVGARDFEVKYTITVQNDGGAPGMYDLTDEIFFEDDVVVTCANYTSTAPTNPANPGPMSLPLSGLWTLGDDMTVTEGTSHTYCLIVCVTMDLMDANTPGDGNYDACGSGGLNGTGEPGQGLYNESYLDLDNDGMEDEVDNACGDLPFVFHEKEFISFMPMANGNHMASYEICVYNTGGADGEYDLWDEPQFDDDLTILSASYSCDTDPGSNLAAPVPTGGWLLLDDQTIAPGATQCCVIEIEVDMDFSDASGGDNEVSQCGAASGTGDPMTGEALYNESTLDVNNDGTIDEMDEACEDIPMIEHEKSIASVTQNSDDSYCIVFNIIVTNESVQAGFYDLYDLPQFDPDIVILSAEYSSSVHIPTTLPTTPPATGWQLANDISLAANGIHIYTIEVCVIMDLQDPVPPGGDNDYTSCGETNGTPNLAAGEGLFNESLLDTNDDGVADQLDTVCADLPYVTHTKAFVDAYRNADGTYTAEFKVTVDNIGGAPGLYDLWDQPNFDDDFEILSASYTTDAIGATANPGPTALTGTGPWTLADDQAIDAGVTQCYNLSVIVDINLSDPDTVGDELYTGCGSANGPMDPEPGEGFYNESFLDRSNDGTPEEIEETCGDIEIVDLAIQKQIVTPGPYQYGQVVEFVHTIYNQGNVPMYNVQLSDYLPAGYGFAGVAGNDANWSQTSPTLLDYSFIAGPIAPASSTTVTLFLEILPTSGGNEDWWNYSEITSMEDENGNDRSDEDVDSNPDSDPNDDNQPEPGDDDDDDITGGGPDAGEDEDDHDVAGIEIFDLGQIKTTTATGPFSYGDVVPYTITVSNQGSETATDIVVIDHLPCGQVYLAANDANGWVYDATAHTATNTIDGPLLPGEMITVMIDVELQQCIDNDPGSFTNISEISGGNGEDGTPGDDIDSDPDGDPNNDGDPIDNTDTDPNDEDDHDPEEIAIWDLGLIKEIVTPGPYIYGQLLEFNITVCNQGNQTAQNILVTDYLPVGYGFDAANQTIAWAPAMTTPNVEFNYAGPLLEDTCVELPLFLTLEMTTGGSDNYTNVSEITSFEDEDGNSGVDSDSTPDDDPNNDGDPNDNSMDDPNDEDDHDPEIIEVFDLAQNKTTTATGPFSYGDAITFTIEVFNQGNVPASNIDVVDHIPCGYMYLASNDALWSYDAASGQAITTITGPLMPGLSTTVDITLELQQCVPNSEDAFLNISEIESAEDPNGDPGDDIDSDPDDDPNNDGDPNDNEVDDPNDSDDHDPENIEIFDVAQIKELVTPGPYSYGQLLEFSITVCNQGNQPVQNIVVTDYMPAGYTFDPADQTATWISVGSDQEHLIAGPLAPEACVSIPLFLTAIQTTGGQEDWINYSEITSFEDTNGDPQEDADSNPGSDGPGENEVDPGDPEDDDLESTDEGGDEDDHDPAGFEVFDLAQIKTTTATGPFSYGDVIPYTITVFNQGSITATDITVVDHLPCGHMYLPANDANGWVYDAAASTATLVIAGPLEPGDMMDVVIDVALQQCIDNDPASFTNISEISSANDDEGNPGDDIDSDPDGDPNNDGDPVDNANDDPNDSDDHDPETVAIFDLAQIKELVTPGPYSYGQLLEFSITVCNQGNQPVQNVVVTDYMPAGYTFDPADQTATWTSVGANQEHTIAGPLAADACVSVPLFLTAIQTTGGQEDWINYSEITSFEDTNGDPQEDADSNPGSDGPGENDVDPGDPEDDDLESTDEGGDEDDHDPAGFEVFDLAQIKTTTATGPFSYGDVIPYTITVFNQGSVTATDITIVDHLPCGHMYLTANDANGWMYDAAASTATLVIAGPLEPGDMMDVVIDVALQQCIDNDPASFTNISEISSANDDEGNPGDDIDSDPDGDPNNDGDPVDNANDDPNDSDDHDPETVAIFDLAQIKELVTPGPYGYDQLLEFSITVCNQGNQPVQNVTVTDYMPVGYTFDPADQTATWTSVGTNQEHTIAGPLAADACVSIPLFLRSVQTTGGQEDWINYSEITSFEDTNGDPQEDADSNPGSNGPGENDVDPGDPADDDLTSTDEGGEEDDHDPAGFEVFDLAQVKTTTAVGPFRYGDPITFTIEVINQGSITATNINITDYIPCGYMYLSSNDGLWSYDGMGQAMTTIAGPLEPGTSTSVDITLEIQQCLPNSNDAFLNISEITDASDQDFNVTIDIDSQPDGDPTNDGDPIDNATDDPNDSDDHDPENIEIWDLAQIKELVTAGPYAYGDLLEFSITVCNQGNQDALNINLIDYLPEGYGFAAANQTVAWTPNADGDVTHLIAGPLVPEECISIPLFLTLERVTGGVGSYTNISEIESFEDEDGNEGIDADSDPDSDPNNDGDPTDDSMDDPNDEDDHDPEVVEIFDLALIKQAVTAGPHSYGDLVEYAYTVTNQGTITAGAFTITDYLPCGLVFDVANNTGWTYDAATGNATYVNSGSLAAGSSEMISIFLTIQECAEAGAWTNQGEISDTEDENGDPIDDIDSDPDTDPNNDGDPVDDAINDPNDEDDSDPETIEIFDIALRKTIQDRGPYAPGEIADFEIELFNQGNVDAYNVEITDYLNVGFVFDPALNPGWTQNGNLITYNYEGPLLAGTTDLIHIYLEIAVPAGATLESWINEAEVSGAENEDGESQTDADSDLDNDPDNDNDVSPGDDDDDVIDGNSNEGEDEDDNDVADVIVTGEIGDTVWKDLDGNGIQDPGEPGVEGVVVNLYDCFGNFIRSLTTDANGYYLFDLLLPGGYQLEFDISNLPEGCDWTYQDQGTDDAADSDVDADGMTECIDVEGGEMNHDIDGGLLPLAKIGDLVWQDCDGDGLQGPGELGLPLIEVLLYHADGTLAGSTMTDMNGAYLFDNLYPGEYYIEVIAPGEYLFTDANQGNSSGSDSDVDQQGVTSIFTLSPGECDLNSGDAGLFECVQIGQLVWFDTNENNVWDAQENGVNGLKVNLYKQNEAGGFDLHDFTYTGHKPDTPSDDGYFKFCVAPGTYYLEFAQPPYGMVPALANQGNFETIDSDVTHSNGEGTTDVFSVRCGEDKCDIGAGYYPMGTIGDYVWLDNNQNGMRDPNESGMANVMVEAYDVNGNMLGYDNTDVDGSYFIDYLQATDVYLKFTPPAGYAATLPHMTLDEMDSDIDNSNGPMTTQYYNIVPGSHIPNVDAGLIYGVVPVEWMSFEGENKGSYNQLDWTVASQIDVSHYEVERSIDDLSNFLTIGKKLSEGTSSEVVDYDYQDYDVATPGTYYYRIKQVDLNGNVDYTEVIAIDIESIRVEQPSASVYPNPMVDDFTLEVQTYEDGLSIEYIIMDVDGKLVTKRTSLAESVSAGKHIFLLSAKELTPGIYTMRVNAGSTIVNKKLIVVSN